METEHILSKDVIKVMKMPGSIEKKKKRDRSFKSMAEIMIKIKYLMMSLTLKIWYFAKFNAKLCIAIARKTIQAYSILSKHGQVDLVRNVHCVQNTGDLLDFRMLQSILLSGLKHSY